jgi:hypothetical protein
MAGTAWLMMSMQWRRGVVAVARIVGAATMGLRSIDGGTTMTFVKILGSRGSGSDPTAADSHPP